MAKDTKVAGDLSAITEQATKQAENAVDAYFDFLKRAISSYPSGGTKLGEKLKSQAEQNVTAVQEYVNQLSQARTVQDAIRIQTEFMQAQFNIFGEQAKELMESYSKAAEGVTTVPSI